jgi:peptidoglycan/xylan/chitin deacetylase (PgdA/CDA1 family)
MDANSPHLTFAPVTRDQARLFAGVARMLDRRGVRCRFAVPSQEVGEVVLDDWDELVASADDAPVTASPSDRVPDDIGAYDAWRGGWSEEQRAASTHAAVRFWRSHLGTHPPRAVVLWNGRDHVFVEAAAFAAAEANVEVICLELGPLRRAPMTVVVSRGGVNAAAEFRRPEKLNEPLTPWETDRLQAVRARFKAGITPHGGSAAYAFLPLQVDDDTQLFHYAPHFADQRAMVAAVVNAMPGDLPLVIKLHPLCDARYGWASYAPLLRGRDRIAPRASNTLGLIAGAAVVITNNSSAGIEGLMFERPVVVLGQAHYRGRGFTHDYRGRDDLRGLIRAAVDDLPSAAALQARERYLYELLFHELVPLAHHPLRVTLDEEEYERLAIRLWDLVQPGHLGSDWHPLFHEIHALREALRIALEASRPDGNGVALLVATRFACACLTDVPGLELAALEDLWPGSAERVANRDVHLLAPDLSAGQRARVAARIRAAGALRVSDLMQDLSRQPCMFHVSRFNRLPRDMRDELHSKSAYWDYYLTQSGIPAENSREKNVQAETLVDWLRRAAPRALLEYGCGDGRILERLAAAADRPWTRLVGVDSSERMLQLARERMKGLADVTLLPADARTALPFANAWFDATLTCGVLAHVPAEDLPAVVAQLHRVTRHSIIHWEVFEAHQPVSGEHYTNPQASRTVHGETFARYGPVRLQVEDVRPLTGQDSLLTRYDLDQPLITVLTLHAVGTPDPACASLDYCNMFLSPDQLGEIVDGLRRAGYRFLTLGEALACVRGAAAPAHKAVVLTFDDGYASVHDVARPLLEERGIRATAFVPIGYIDRSFDGNSRAGSGPALPMMNPGQIRALRDAGWDVGAHSVSHRLFAGLSRDDAWQELAESKACLEALLGQAVSTFAFPYGEPGVAYRPEHVELAAEAGYELALSMRPGFVPIGHEAIDWPRVGVGIDTSADALLDDLATLHRATHGWPPEPTESGPSLKERVRGAVRHCVEKGVEHVALYGAGRHTARLLQTVPLWPLHVLGIVDDDAGLRGSTRYGLPVYAAADLSNLPLDAVLISSDQYEEAIYQRIAPLEARGIRVLRLYDNGS